MPEEFERITVFLDRDGTLNPDLGYLKSPEELELFPGAAESVARLNEAHIRVVLVTNQSGVARGLFSLKDLESIHEKLQYSLRVGGASLDAIYVCPHHPDDNCVCRKPNVGLLERAATEHGVKLSKSYVVGDKQSDVELAAKVGAVAVLVTSSPHSHDALSALQAGELHADCVAADIREVVDWIFQDAEKRKWS